MASTQQFIIRTTDHSLAFALHRDGDVIDYEEYDFKRSMSLATNLREAFHTSDLLRGAGKEIVVTTDNPVLLVPIEEYDEKQMMEQYTYVYPAAKNIILRSAMLPSLKTMVVFAIDKDLVVVLSDHFETIHIEPIMARLWNFFLRRKENALAKAMYVYFYDNKFFISSFHNKRFVFANVFHADNAQDAAYYILGSWQQINGKGNRDELIVCGVVPYREEFISTIQHFVSRITTFSPADEFHSAIYRQLEKLPLDLMMQFV